MSTAYRSPICVRVVGCACVMRGAGPGVPPLKRGWRPPSLITRLRCSFGGSDGPIESRAARVMEGTQWMRSHDDGAARLGRMRCVERADPGCVGKSVSFVAALRTAVAGMQGERCALRATASSSSVSVSLAMLEQPSTAVRDGAFFKV